MSLFELTDYMQATGPVGETDAQGFLTSVQAIEPTIKDSLVQIVNKKPAFQGACLVFCLSYL